jgi:hypothetical protein
MGSLKTAFGAIGALIPVCYCGGLALYFFGVGGNSLQAANAIGLGPTIIGLSAIGLLSCIPLLIKLVRFSTSPASRPGGKPGKRAIDDGAGETFDADAALARYLARKAAEGGSTPSGFVEAPRPQGFGRKLG